MAEDAVDRLFAPPVRGLARDLIAIACALPDVAVDPKGTCIHLNRRVAFAGLHPRKTGVLLNLRTSAPIEHERFRKTERLSAHRYNNETLIESADALDATLRGWLAEAHALAA